MGKTTKRKFYRPGTLPVAGTKIVLKTQPYLYGVLLEPRDPITSFREYFAFMDLVLRGYEIMSEIPGIDIALGDAMRVDKATIERLKLMIQYLAESPIEVILKETEEAQVIELCNELAAREVAGNVQ
jgi:hypothetical protein